VSEKPIVFSNLAMSLDGKIATATREFFALGTPYDRDLMQVLRKKSDVVVMGASTLRQFKRFCGIRMTSASQPANAIFSSQLEGFDLKWPYFSRPQSETRRIFFVSSDCPAGRIRKFETVAEIVKIPRRKSAALFAKQWLVKNGMKQILVEGGGSVMWDFCENNLIDRYYVTLTPTILGGKNSPTLVDGLGFSPQRRIRLKLKQARRRGDELYLIYDKSI